MFLKFLYLNLKEASGHSNGAVWRTFKGRLHTRLHDKRIAELDLSGFINVAYLFCALIKCFSGSTLLAECQLKYEQLEGFYRILNVFVKTKSLHKLESILSLNAATSSQTSAPSTTTANSSAKLNAIKTIFSTKFAALRLWYESNEHAATMQEEMEASVLKQEFVNVINEWLAEASALFGFDLGAVSGHKSSDQISRCAFHFLDRCKLIGHY